MPRLCLGLDVDNSSCLLEQIRVSRILVQGIYLGVWILFWISLVLFSDNTILIMKIVE